MAYRGSSRSIGIVKQCAIYVRGEARCVWCRIPLRAPHTQGHKHSATATIDHADGDHGNNAPSNLLPACRGCNTQRPWAEGFEARLALRGESLEGAWSRANAQLEAPIDRAAGKRLADRWHPGRFEAEKEHRRTYEARKKREKR